MDHIISRRVIFALELGTMLAVIMYAGGRLVIGPAGYWYLIPNLILGYTPLGLSFVVVWAARRLSWKHWVTWVASVLWLLFLPNSFYIICDAVHLTQHLYGLDPLFAQVMFALFAVLGMLAGFVSVRAVHLELGKRLSTGTAYWLVELILLSSSIGIYLGRTLRLNSWDVVARPVQVLRDVIQVTFHPDGLTALTTMVFFALLSVIYAAVWLPLADEHRPNHKH